MALALFPFRRLIRMTLVGAALTAGLQLCAQRVVMLAGGGSEGANGDASAWSYELYRSLITGTGADRNNDGRMTVVTLSMDPINTDPTKTYAAYFKSLGVSNVDAFDFVVTTPSQANASTLLNKIALADAIFITGGDQGTYYDTWMGTSLMMAVKNAVAAGASIGGTSAGCMSMAQYCFSGCQDMVSPDVLANAKTTMLEDVSEGAGSSGIHTDFFNMVPGVTLDTHVTERARLGRMLGVLAKATEDSGNNGILGIGIDSYTGLVYSPATKLAKVYGRGTVHFVQHRPSTTRFRISGKPLVYENLRLDALIHGWSFNLQTKQPIAPSPLSSNYKTLSNWAPGLANSGSLTISGTTASEESKFAKKVAISPSTYSVSTSTATTKVLDAIGIMNAHYKSSDYTPRRASAHESILTALYDNPTFVGFLVASGSSLSRSSGAPDLMDFSSSTATLVFDPSTATAADKNADYTSTWNTTSSGTSLRACGFVNMTLHVLGDSTGMGFKYNTRTRDLGTGSTPTIPTITSQPGNTTVNLGQSASFNVVASGSGLSYQWFKNGGSISSATSASHTTPATTATDHGSKFKVTVSNTAGSVTSTEAILTVISDPVGTEKILNGGFESGTANWSGDTGNIGQWTGMAAYEGAKNVWFCGKGASTNHTLYQTLSIPSTATSASLSFYLKILSDETSTSTAYDKFYIKVRSSSGSTLATLATYSNLDKSSNYLQRTFNLGAYKGQTIQIYFNGTEDSRYKTSYLLDKVSLMVQ